MATTAVKHIANAKTANNIVTASANDKGVIVNAYPSNKEYAWILLTQQKIVIDGGWVRESVRTTLQRGTTALLEKWISSYANNAYQLPGNIVVEEYLEDAIPPAVAKDNLRPDVTFEEAIKGFLKRAGADGPVLTKDGKRIVRFTKWDPTGTIADVTVQHDPLS
jgi:hypothetical protein